MILTFNRTFILVLCLWLSCNRSGRNSFQSEQLSVVERQDIVLRITVSGNVVPNMTSSIQPSFSGYIRKIYVSLGQLVEKDKPLVLISPGIDTPIRDLFPIRCPFKGTIVQILRSEGEYLDPSGSNAAAILRVDDLSRLFVSADVPEVDFPKIKKGQEVNIRVSPITQRTYKGVVTEMAMAATQEQGNFRGEQKVVFNVRIEITNADKEIRPGMSALVDIIPEKRQGVLALRHEYIYIENDTYYVVKENGEKQTVQVGLQNEELIEVLSGLAEGEKVRQVDFLSLSP